MLNLQSALTQDITEGITAAMAAGELGSVDVPPVVVKHTDTHEHGDYASPIALALARQLKQPPLDIAAAIGKHMPKKEYVGKVEAMAPGFLNIRLNPGWLSARLDDLIEQDLCADITVGHGRRINLELAET